LWANPGSSIKLPPPGPVRGGGGHLLGHHLQRRRVRATATLELQQVLRHGPAVVDLADHVRLRDTHLVEEDLILDLLARRHDQGADLDARRSHVDQHERDALLLLGGARRADQGEHPVGLTRVRGPDLAARADEVAARLI
jgi:hypothetical protein